MDGVGRGDVYKRQTVRSGRIDRHSRLGHGDARSQTLLHVPDPDRLIKEFWDIVNNPNKTSVNVLSSKDVFVQEVDGDRIVVINVPRAERSYKPIYVDGNPLCTYRRNGEGDYRCTKEEYQAMVRDASVKTQDMLILNEMDMTVFNKEKMCIRDRLCI